MDHADHNDYMLAKWLAGALTPEEEQSLHQREDFEDLQAIVKGMEGLEPPPFSENKSWENLRQRIAKENPSPQEEATKTDTTNSANTPIQKETPVRSLLSWKHIAGIAAGIALIVAALWWSTGGETRYSTEIVTSAGEQTKITLPDGSSVKLNASSKLGFSEEEWPAKRKVALTGEGYFRAQKGNSFTVHTKQGDVTVVGTIFNVYAREKELDVKCMEGKVQVINPKGSERVLIKAGEQVSVQNGRMQNRRGIDFSPKWFDGVSTYKSAPLRKVFDEMERQYGIRVVGEQLSSRSFSGKFVHKDLQKALKMVCDPMDLKYEVSGDTIRVF